MFCYFNDVVVIFLTFKFFFFFFFFYQHPTIQSFPNVLQKYLFSICLNDCFILWCWSENFSIDEELCCANLLFPSQSFRPHIYYCQQGCCVCCYCYLTSSPIFIPFRISTDQVGLFV